MDVDSMSYDKILSNETHQCQQIRLWFKQRVVL